MKHEIILRLGKMENFATVLHKCRKMSSMSRLRLSYYEVLGITPNASANDIKSAYYKLSKMYHPDKCEDEATEKRFRAITEAYEVLGNAKSKKQYDESLLVIKRPEESKPKEVYPMHRPPVDLKRNFYMSHEINQQARVTQVDGRTLVRDWDWKAKKKYESLLRETFHARSFARAKERKQREDARDSYSEALVYLMAAVVGTVAYVMWRF